MQERRSGNFSRQCSYLVYGFDVENPKSRTLFEVSAKDLGADSILVEMDARGKSGKRIPSQEESLVSIRETQSCSMWLEKHKNNTGLSEGDFQIAAPSFMS